MPNHFPWWVNKQRTLGQGGWEGGTHFPHYVPSCVRYRATCRSGNDKSLHPGGYCEQRRRLCVRTKLYKCLDKLPCDQGP